jgi:hypothetical protein
MKNKYTYRKQVLKQGIMKTLLMSLLMLPFLAQAQGPFQDRLDKMEGRLEAQRAAYITNELELTAQESQTFWPIFNEWKAEEMKNRRKVDPETNTKSMTEAEADRFIQQLFEMQEKETEIRKSYFKKLRTVVPPQKLARLPAAERGFREQIVRQTASRIKQMKEKRKN